MSSLKSDFLRGTFWSSIQQFGKQGIAFLVSIILARLLDPSEFGLIAMLSVFISIGTSLMDSGLTSSLIRSKNLTNEDYSTVFYFNIIGSALVYLILFLLSPFIAEFYDQPTLKSLLRWQALLLIINSTYSIQYTRFTIDMDFKTQTITAIPSVIIGGAIGVSMAYLGYGVWSIIGYILTQSTANTIQLWYYSEWRPTLVFSKQKFKQHFNFGYKLTLAGLLNTIFSEIYTIVIGKYFSATQLGYYNRALSFRNLPITNISSVLGKVTYPTFAKISDDNIKLKNVYSRLLQIVIFIIAPMLTFMGILGEPIFRLVLTEKWLPAVPFFQILVIPGILYPIHSYNLNVLKIKNRTDLIFKLEIAKKLLIIISIIIGIQFGIYGLLFSSVVTSILAFYINTYYSGKFIDLSGIRQIKLMMPSLLITILSGFIVWFIDSYLVMHLSDVLRILLGLSIGSTIYLLICYLVRVEAMLEFITLIKDKL